MPEGIALLLIVVLLAFNAFFVGAEFAVTSTRRAQLEPLVESGKRGSVSALYAVEHVSVMLATCQLGVTLASTGLGVVAEPAIAHMIDGPLVRWGMPAASAHIIGFIIALIIVLYLHVVLGEMVPKNLSISANVAALLLYAPVLVRLTKAIRWLTEAMNHVANAFLRIFGIKPQDEVASTFTVEEVASIVELSAAEGTLDDDLGLLAGSLEFSEELVSQVMVGLDDLVTLDLPVSASMVEKEVARTGYSRFPVTDEAKGIVGYIHIKDVLWAKGQERELPLDSWRIRALPEVRVDMEVEQALEEMQKSGTHLAKVKKENLVVGVIFLEDILEELIGEVRDSLQRENPI